VTFGQDIRLSELF